MADRLVCPAFHIGVLVVGSGGGGSVESRPMVLCDRLIQAGSQGQWLGKYRKGGVGVGPRAGMLTR